MKVVSQVERVKKIVVLNRALSLDMDELTVTQKIRRTAVFGHYQKYLDALYQGSSE
jgi:long-subunit acyl-CoA synthetase (AMP-forming)